MNTKTVLILAAGRGTRLAPLTDDRPKGLVPVLGKPILAYALEALAPAAREGRCQVAVVIGHKGDQIASYVGERFPFVRTIWNHDFARTNNMFSLYLGMSAAAPDAPVVYMNGDCLYHRDIVQSAVASKSTVIFCDETQFNAESMKITVSDDRIASISKAIEERDAHAVSCDLYALEAQDAQALREILHEYVARADLNLWSEVALALAMERRSIHFRPASVEGKYWYEIDTLEDLDAATARVKGSVG
jgi:choline kinase